MPNRCHFFHLHRRIAVLGILCLTLKGSITAEISYPLPTVDFTLNEKTKLEFCIVPLEIGNAPFATREFWLGGRGIGGFKEPPTRALISGCSVLSVDGKPDWCLLIGKTEVTVGQWNAMMGLETPEAESENLPKTRISKAEIQLFLEKLNAAIYAKNGGLAFHSPIFGSLSHVFIRLPSEKEWEFAARGGLAVDATRFDNPTPYTGELNRFEWLAGQHSSKGKLKPVGLLDPNPLGLHDMLGNAAEIVDGFYQLEYSQGRFGGLVIRGGDFRTNEENLRASLRFEVPFVFEDNGTAYRASHVGFRLAIGSMILPTAAANKDLENAWAEHKEKRIQPTTSVSGTAPLAQSVKNETNEMRQLVKEMAEKHAIGDMNAIAAGSTLSTLEALIASLVGKVERAEKFSGLSAIRLGSITSYNVIGDLALINLARTNQAPLNLTDLERKVDRAKMVIEDSCKLLGEVTPTMIGKQFDEWEKILQERGAVKQIEATQVFRKAAFEYMVNRRLDLDSWRSGLEKIALAGDP
jgi:hypothetical protein